MEKFEIDTSFIRPDFIFIRPDFIPSVGHKRFPRKLKKALKKLLFVRTFYYDIEINIKSIRRYKIQKIQKSDYPYICANTTKDELKYLPKFSI